jgi:UDP-N-acetylglucosamine acyltransferase
LNNIHSNAIIADTVEIASFCTIDEDVVIGDNTKIGPNVVILNGTRIGKNCNIHTGAVLGGIPQDLKFDNEYSQLVIGDFVTVREYCTLNRGTKQKGITSVDNHALIMAYTHVAHDCQIGQHAILANSVHLAGHIEIGDWAVISALSAVHQFVKIGRHAMISGGSLVRKDVPPYVKAAREPLCYAGVNKTGLERRGYSNAEINEIHEIYSAIYVRSQNVSKAIANLEKKLSDSLFLKEIAEFIGTSERGVMKGYRGHSE